jgi:hypothetical protein
VTCSTEKMALRFKVDLRLPFVCAWVLAVSMASFAQSSPVSPARQEKTLGSPAPSGGSTAATTGTVHTAAGAPIPGATVRLTDTSTNKVWVSWTDESGKFEFPASTGAHVRVEASQLGFIEASEDVELPAPSGKPIALVLRVRTVAELSAPSRPGNATRGGDQRGARNGSVNPADGSRPSGPGTPGQFRANGSRGQLPAGVANAIRQGLGGGFEQTDLTGESNAGGGQAAETNEPAIAVSSGGPSGASSDSFLLQGSVGQGLSVTGQGGFGPRGPGEGVVGGLGPGVPGGPGGGSGGAPVEGFGAGGQAGPGGGGGGRGGGPGGGGGGRMFRQSVNRLRLSVYDRYDNSALDAKPYSITGNEFPKISDYDERFGGNLGGPFKIPHIYNGTDHTYLFVNFQHETQKAAVNTFSTVPTQAERSGNFCGLGITLYDPFSNLSGPRTPLGNGCQIPTINSAAAGLLAYYPLPNVPGQVAQNYLLEATTPVNSDLVNLHLLHTINSRFNVNGGYNFNSQRKDTLGNFPDIRGHQSTRSQSVSLGLSHNWSAHLVENTQLNWSRNRIEVRSDNSFRNNIAGSLGIAGTATDPINYGIPAIQFTSLSSLNDPVPSLVRNQTLRFSDSWSWVRAKHTMTFGGEIRRIQLNTDSDPNPRGRFIFTGLLTTQLNANGQPAVRQTRKTEPYYEFADFLLGLPYNTSVQFGNPNTYLRGWGFIAYAQDDWRVDKSLTLQFGVRYQAMPPPIELFNHLANLDLNGTATAVAAVTPGEIAPYSGRTPRALVHGDYRNWAPRVGFAWQPNIKPKTVVRAGYSIFYNVSVYATLAEKYLAYQPPFDETQNFYTAPAQVLTLQNGFVGQTQAKGRILNTAGVNPNYKDGYAQIWMLGTETSFTQNWILDLTYTGTKGTDLDLLRAPNRAPLGTSQLSTQRSLAIPYATSFYYDQSGANSIYHALQARVVHRFAHGVSFQAAYTFAKSLDNASSIGGSTPIVVQNDHDFAAERGLSSFDLRHQLRVSSTYELPFGQRSRWANHGWAEHALGNWRLLNIVTWQTGTPVTALLGGSAANNSGTGSNFSERADQVGNPNLGICGGPSGGYFNTSAFATPAPGRYGDERRGAIEGPCTFSWNLSLAKSFRFGPEQRHTVNASWEIQNLTNTPNFNGIGSLLGSSTFGRVTGAGSMRTMDIMIRLNF